VARITTKNTTTTPHFKKPKPRASDINTQPPSPPNHHHDFSFFSSRTPPFYNPRKKCNYYDVTQVLHMPKTQICREKLGVLIIVPYGTTLCPRYPDSPVNGDPTPDNGESG